MPGNNIFDAECSNNGGVPARVYSPAVDDGYYALLEALPPGKHTVIFHVEVRGQSIGDVTYHLTVVPVLTK